MFFTPKHEYQSVFESMSESEKMYEIQTKGFFDVALQNSAKERRFKENGEEALKVHKTADRILIFQDQLILDFEKNIMHYSSFLKHTSVPTFMYFDQKKIDQYNKMMTDFKNDTLTSISNHRIKKDKIEYLEANFKYLPSQIALLKLKAQKTRCLDKLMMTLNELADQTTISYCGIDPNVHRLQVLPITSIVKINEPFKAYVIIQPTIFRYDPMHSTIDFYESETAKPVRMINFVATFEKIFTKPGLQKFTVYAQTTNTLTGERSTSSTNYTVNVLEK
jgi:hypothetical protein